MLPYKSQKCRLTSRYGYRVHPIHGWRHFHGGIDLVGIGGDDIVAVAPGKVVRSRIVTNKADATWQWGNYVAVQGTDGVTIYYCHLAKRLVNVGDVVNIGDVIGIEGMTGQVTGKHLHFECRRGSTQIDAAEYIGIDNEVGSYVGLDAALKRLKALGVINSPEYWLIHSGDLKYIDELIIKSAARITKAGAPMSDLTLALERLSGAGIINTPQYWKSNAGKVPYLAELIYKLGGCV